VHEDIAMASTTFTGPVNSLNGFSGTILSTSASITNLVVSTGTITNLSFDTVLTGDPSGTLADQVGHIPVLVGGSTFYIALYTSLTP
jgi:hypothetical protein